MIKFYTALVCFAMGGILSAQSITTAPNKTSQSPTNVKQAHGTTEIRSTQDEAQIDLPGFPQYISTGNKELDDKNFNEAKEKWISENTTLYSDYLKRKKDESNNSNTNEQPK